MPTPSGLDDVRFRAAMERTKNNVDVMEQVWTMQYHPDEDWRLVDGAPNHWYGTLETMDGEEILNLAACAVTDFLATYRFALHIVTAHNFALLGEFC